MPGNRKITSKTIKGKDGIHPGSRKGLSPLLDSWPVLILLAGQLGRVHLRTLKLQRASKNRRDNLSVKRESIPHDISWEGYSDPVVQRPLFFLHSVSSPHPINIPSLQALVELYIGRNDIRLQELESERRAGRPKSKEQLDFEEHKRKENNEWATGFGQYRRSTLFCAGHG